MSDHLPFEILEYYQRLDRTRMAMTHAGLDLLVVTDPANMAWLTGYDGWSFYTPQAVIVGPKGPPVWWGRGMDAQGARRTVWMEDADIVGFADHFVQNPAAHALEDLARVILDRGWGTGAVGVELDAHYYTAAGHFALEEGLPEADLMDATGLVNWQRVIKSDTEIGYMRAAAGITKRMHETVWEVAKPGLPKNELIAAVSKASIEGANGHWGDYPAIVPMAPSGADAIAPHLTWDNRPLAAGETTFLELCGVHRRYHAPQSRTFVLGTIPDRYKAAEAAVIEGISAGLAVAKPGNTAGDIARALDTTLAKHGFAKESRCGYSIGLAYPPDWGESTVSFRAMDETVLRPRMLFHFMPGLWLDDGGIEITEPILITENGAECLIDLPRGIKSL